MENITLIIAFIIIILFFVSRRNKKRKLNQTKIRVDNILRIKYTAFPPTDISPSSSLDTKLDSFITSSIDN